MLQTPLNSPLASASRSSRAPWGALVTVGPPGCGGVRVRRSRQPPPALRSAPQVGQDIAALRQLTDRPFGVNHTMKPFVEDVFAEIVRAAPPVVSFALGFSSDLVKRAHDGGSLFVQQVHSAPRRGGGRRWCRCDHHPRG